MKYGFLYKEYKINAFYWELIKIFEKIGIIIILNYYFDDIKVKGILVFMIVCAYSALSLII
jgi:hypothetical protein